MNWASDVGVYRPNFNQLYVKKDTVLDFNSFNELISLYDLKIFSEEKDYYILEGSDIDLDTFKNYWNYDT